MVASQRQGARPSNDGYFAFQPKSLTLQFRPEGPYQDGLVIEAMALDGRYRSQFETGISNGGLTAYPGGDRWRWESRLFASRYDHLDSAVRPVYGAWKRKRDPYGGSPQTWWLQLRALGTTIPKRSNECGTCSPDSDGKNS